MWACPILQRDQLDTSVRSLTADDGCVDCCIKCLGGVPYASLLATILCFSGVALFCGCGHVALSGTLTILENNFYTNPSETSMLTEIICLLQYVIYGIASFFFLYGIILLAEGFYTTSAVKELHGEFKTTICGRCISAMVLHRSTFLTAPLHLPHCTAPPPSLHRSTSLTAPLHLPHCTAPPPSLHRSTSHTAPLHLPHCTAPPPSLHRSTSLTAPLHLPHCTAPPPSLHRSTSLTAPLHLPHCTAPPPSLHRSTSHTAPLHLPHCTAPPPSLHRSTSHTAPLHLPHCTAPPPTLHRSTSLTAPLHLPHCTAPPPSLHRSTSLTAPAHLPHCTAPPPTLHRSTSTFVFLTYILGVAWLGVFGFSSIPVFLFYNIWSTCASMASSSPANSSVCVDMRQYGIIPWNATPGVACGSSLLDICNSNEFYLSYHLYIVACAGAGATVIAMIHYLMILSANWAYLKDASQMHAYQDIKTKEEQELQDIQSRSKECLNSYS
ncbi:hypothetical protein QTP70_011048 [Hemibagrus guttatus]|uniref:Neuronal membrane glycoprotein M6-b n=1 Tax=Hemibagrus guttatus TaxID=175788 RepID=A0AAE0V7D9_9TELE|nr:hypothetical protein QTP70_011048 [Hemibagrus guttatus]